MSRDVHCYFLVAVVTLTKCMPCNEIHLLVRLVCDGNSVWTVEKEKERGGEKEEGEEGRGRGERRLHIELIDNNGHIGVNCC